MTLYSHVASSRSSLAVLSMSGSINLNPIGMPCAFKM
jgi:hypothetical protein